MNLLCLDLATVTGIARGPVGQIPESWSVRLCKAKTDVQAAPRALGTLLVKLIREQRPDLIAAEHTVPPGGQQHEWTIVAQEQLHGALFAVAGIFNIPVIEPYPSSIRKHVLGQGRARPGQDIKALVIHRMQLLGYIPKDCFDNNRADSTALFAYMEDVECRMPPKRLVLFGT